jgi:integrase
MLTDLSIKNLMRADRRPDKRTETADGKISGLYFVRQPGGAASWAVRYRFAGKPKKLTLGSYPAVNITTARKRAQEALGDLAGGEDPAAQKRAVKEAQKAQQTATDRIADVAAVFVEKHAKRKAGALWAAETERLLRVEILPRLGARRLSEITKAHTHDLLDEMVERGSPTTANRALAVLKKLGNWSVERGLITLSPFAGIKPPAPERARDRILSDDELKVAWRAFEIVGWPFGDIARLLLLTGARRDEIAEGRWSEVDLDAKILTIAKERSKNGVAHEIPLSDKAIEILQSVPHIGDKKDGIIFSTNGRTPVSGFSRAKESIDKAILASMRDADEHAVAPLAWVFHDLRRSSASGMAGLGIPPHVVEALLGHRSGTIKGVAAVYNRYSYATEQRHAVDAWARRLEAIVTGGEPSNLIELSTSRGA